LELTARNLYQQSTEAGWKRGKFLPEGQLKKIRLCVVAPNRGYNIATKKKKLEEVL
jgi:hypothetical protein